MKLCLLTVLMAATCTMVAAQPYVCHSCALDSDHSKCDDLYVSPSHIPVEPGMCDKIADLPSEQAKLCKKYDKHPGYYVECSNGAMSFSCKASCGIKVEDVGKNFTINNKLQNIMGNGLLKGLGADTHDNVDLLQGSDGFSDNFLGFGGQKHGQAGSQGGAHAQGPYGNNNFNNNNNDQGYLNSFDQNYAPHDAFNVYKPLTIPNQSPRYSQFNFNPLPPPQKTVPQHPPNYAQPHVPQTPQGYQQPGGIQSYPQNQAGYQQTQPTQNQPGYIQTNPQQNQGSYNQPRAPQVYSQPQNPHTAASYPSVPQTGYQQPTGPVHQVHSQPHNIVPHANPTPTNLPYGTFLPQNPKTGYQNSGAASLPPHPNPTDKPHQTNLLNAVNSLPHNPLVAPNTVHPADPHVDQAYAAGAVADPAVPHDTKTTTLPHVDPSAAPTSASQGIQSGAAGIAGAAGVPDPHVGVAPVNVGPKSQAPNLHNILQSVHAVSTQDPHNPHAVVDPHPSPVAPHFNPHADPHSVPHANLPVDPHSFPHANLPVDPHSVPHANLPVDPHSVPHANLPVDPHSVPHANLPVDPHSVPHANLPVDPHSVPHANFPVDPHADPHSVPHENPHAYVPPQVHPLPTAATIHAAHPTHNAAPDHKFTDFKGFGAFPGHPAPSKAPNPYQQSRDVSGIPDLTLPNVPEYAYDYNASPRKPHENLAAKAIGDPFSSFGHGFNNGFSNGYDQTGHNMLASLTNNLGQQIKSVNHNTALGSLKGQQNKEKLSSTAHHGGYNTASSTSGSSQGGDSVHFSKGKDAKPSNHVFNNPFFDFMQG